MCLTYQAASGILPMFTALLAVRLWLRGRPFRDVLRFVGAAAAGYCAALILFKVALIHPSIVDYADTTISPPGQLIPHAIDILWRYFRKIVTGFDRKWLLLIGLLCLAYIGVTVRDAARKKLPALLLALACVAVLFLLSFGVYPFLSKPLLQARTMYGLGACLAFLAVSVASAKKALPAKLVCFALSWCFFVFAFTTGNALDAQKNYTDFRIREVIDGLKEQGDTLFSSDEPVLMLVTGDIGYAPSLQNTIQQFPLLDGLIPHTFGDYSWLTSYGLSRYYGLPDITWMDQETLDLTKFQLPLLDETIYHAIYGSDPFLLIELK